MTPNEKIAKLEGLLARVKERAEGPRGAASPAKPAQIAGAPAGAPAPAPRPAAAFQRPAAPPFAAAPPMAAPPAVAAPAPVAAPPAIAAPPLVAAPPPVAPPVEPAVMTHAYPPDDSEIDVEVSAEVVEVEIDDDEPALTPAESGAQLVAEVATEAADAALDDAPAAEVSASEVTFSDDDAEDITLTSATAPITEPQTPANEVIEPSPSSSPRPITIAESHYEEDGAPRHTPPPESGKQVATASVKPPDSERIASLAPDSSIDSEEGNTLIGGWREPGVPFAQPRAVPTAPAPAPVPPPAGRQDRLEATLTKAQLVDAPVAIVDGTVATFEPASFGDLLEATLRL